MPVKRKSMMSAAAPAHGAGFARSARFQLFLGPIQKRLSRTFGEDRAQGFFKDVAKEKGRLPGEAVAGVNGAIRQEGNKLGEATVVGAAIERHAAVNDPLEDAVRRVDGYGRVRIIKPDVEQADQNLCVFLRGQRLRGKRLSVIRCHR